MLGAVFLGLFFQQAAFVGHDTGHLSVNRNRLTDSLFGIFAGNFFTGISVGWWKATHNIHHAMPNSVFDDPDIAHLPVFAVSSRLFDSLFNTYHNRVMPFDWAARNIFIPNQHYLYYPIMAVARANLYLQGMIRLVKNRNIARAQLPTQTQEWATLLGFFGWMGFMFAQLNSGKARLAFFLISHAVAGLLQVQITLSHFSKPVNEGKVVNYGGDFYTRNIIASMDVDCPPWLDWFHGGLQFQALHHCYPRLHRQYLRKTLPLIKAVCAKHNIHYSSKSFYEANVEIVECLRDAAEKSKTWSPKIWESVNAEG
jgi:delta8-fatty-acid desaturase